MSAGVGNTVVSEVLSRSQLDFGAQFVGRSWQLEVEVANKGRKGAALTWSNSRLADLAKTFSKSAKGTGRHPSTPCAMVQSVQCCVLIRPERSC